MLPPFKYSMFIFIFNLSICVFSADKAEKKTSQIPETWSKQTKGKRVRTIFTPEQLERMEAEFERQQYMVGTER